MELAARLSVQGVRAGRHYRRRLQGAALVALQGNVAQAHAAWRLSAVHLSKRRHLLVAAMLQVVTVVVGTARATDALKTARWTTRARMKGARWQWLCVRMWPQAWHHVAQYLRHLSRCSARVEAQRAQRVRRHVLLQWAAWRRRRARHRAHEVQAWYYYAFSTLTRALACWRLAVRWGRGKRERLAAAERHARRVALARGVQAWRRAVAWGRQQRAQLAAAAAWHRCAPHRAHMHAGGRSSSESPNLVHDSHWTPACRNTRACTGSRCSRQRCMPGRRRQRSHATHAPTQRACSSITRRHGCGGRPRLPSAPGW